MLTCLLHLPMFHLSCFHLCSTCTPSFQTPKKPFLCRVRSGSNDKSVLAFCANGQGTKSSSPTNCWLGIPHKGLESPGVLFSGKEVNFIAIIGQKIVVVELAQGVAKQGSLEQVQVTAPSTSGLCNTIFICHSTQRVIDFIPNIATCTNAFVDIDRVIFEKEGRRR